MNESLCCRVSWFFFSKFDWWFLEEFGIICDIICWLNWEQICSTFWNRQNFNLFITFGIWSTNINQNYIFNLNNRLMAPHRKCQLYYQRDYLTHLPNNRKTHFSKPQARLTNPKNHSIFQHPKYLTMNNQICLKHRILRGEKRTHQTVTN
jgi:hypothetical protein